MSRRAEVLSRIDWIIGRPSKPLLAADLAHGWSETSRIAMLGLFEDLRRCLRSPEPLAEKYKSLNISRGMDSWGITGGDMLSLAVAMV
jgi:hypothetical protein